jgi:zinc transport system substrate-binding protein
MTRNLSGICLSKTLQGEKNTMYIRLVTLLLFFIFAMPLQSMAQNKITIYTVNYPLSYFAERIGGNLVNVVFPAPPNVDPAFWMPDTAAIRGYQKADLIILNGADYEKWTKKVSLPMLRTVNTSKAFKDKLIHIETNVTHSHGPSGDHSHGGTVFTTWLDFSQAVQQAETIYKAFSHKLPANKSDFFKNFESLKQDLLELDARMTALSAKIPGLPLFASHPIYQYMARRYNLNLKMVMWEPDAAPGESEWKHIQELINAHPAGWMIWEGEPLPESAKHLQDMNIKSLVFSPCFARPQQGDFLSVMRKNIKNMEIVFN